MSEIILTHHVKSRLIERSVPVHDAKSIAKNGKTIKITTDGLIKKKGVSYDGRVIIVVCQETKYPKHVIIIVTAYYDDKSR